MKRITFSNFKAAIIAALQLGHVFSNPLERLFAGRILTQGHSFVRDFDPRVWLQEYLGWAGFVRAPKRGRNVGYIRRQGPNELRIARPNYAKQNRRTARALLKFNGEPAVPFTALGNHEARITRRAGTYRDATTGLMVAA